jgi:hypothetical protein
MARKTVNVEAADPHASDTAGDATVVPGSVEEVPVDHGQPDLEDGTEVDDEAEPRDAVAEGDFGPVALVPEEADAQRVRSEQPSIAEQEQPHPELLDESGQELAPDVVREEVQGSALPVDRGVR